MRYELLPHTADIAFRVRTDSLRGLYENAAFALEDILVDTSGARPAIQERITVTGSDPGELLIALLDELLFIFETRRLIFSRIQVETFSDTELAALAEGEEYDPSRHELRNVAKAVTWHNAAIIQRGGIWETTVVLDV
ncbi:MAG TPA: archease [Candidatus Brocadiia bacterium]|nr:archease [Candidatus Brocadiia bacterium]